MHTKTSVQRISKGVFIIICNGASAEIFNSAGGGEVFMECDCKLVKYAPEGWSKKVKTCTVAMTHNCYTDYSLHRVYRLYPRRKNPHCQNLLCFFG